MNSVINYINSLLFLLLPETGCFGFKRFLLRCAGIKVGTDVRVCSSVRFMGSGSLEIGSGTWIGHQTLIISSSQVKIGENVDIAPMVYIGTGTHLIEPGGLRIAGRPFSKEVEIGNGAWIGAKACILPGVKVGTKAVVAAGAVLVDSCSDKAIFAGVPAKKVKDL